MLLGGLLAAVVATFVLAAPASAAATCNGLTTTIEGTAGPDTINGTAGADVISALAGNDVINGLGGNDVICGGDGNDTIDASTGVDTVSYAASSAGVTADLTTGTATGEGSDGLIAVENLTGSPQNDNLTGNGAANAVVGGAGTDILNGRGGNDALDGSTGTDTASFSGAPTGVSANLTTGTSTGDGDDTLVGVERLTGSAKADTLTGNTVTNVLNGGAGDDTLAGGGGNDALNGSTGTDTANFSAATAAVNANLATGTATGEGSDTLSAVENLTGSAHADTLTGDGLPNVLAGGAGDDTLDGAAGVNTATYAASPTGLTASLTTGTATGEGSDTLLNIANLTGSPQNDNLTGNSAANALIGGGGNDTLSGRGGDDALDGSTGTDTANFSAATAAVNANLATGTATGEGSDTLVGLERLTGSTKADTLTGDAGANLLNGGAGNDTLAGGGGNDALNGGTGIDATTFSAATAAVNANLATGTATGEGSDSLIAVENLTGSAHADTLTGNAGPNVFAGGAGDDVFDGAGGADTASYAASPAAVTANLVVDEAGGEGTDDLLNIENLTGSPFDDTLTGDAGPNVLDAGADSPGEAGADTCRVDAGVDSGVNCEIVEGADTAPSTTDTYTFKAPAGQKVFVDLGTCENWGQQWRLVAPGGAEVFNRSLCEGDVGQLTLTTAGTHTLEVSSSEGGAYAFRWWEVPAPQSFSYTIGNTVSDGVPAAGAGNIESPGAVDIYTFSNPTANNKMFFDDLGCWADLKLVGPGGAEVIPNQWCAGLQNQYTLTTTGTYTLTVSTPPWSDGTGAYSFRIVKVPAPQSFSYTIGNTVSDGVPAAGAGNIESPGAVDIYTFSNPTANNKVFFDDLGCWADLKLVGPGGAEVIPNQWCAGLQNQFTLAATGTYTLTVSTPPWSEGTGAYSFRIVKVPAPQSFSYTIGNTVSDGVPAAGAGNIESPGAVDIYTFSNPTANNKVFFDDLGCWADLKLVGPGGAEVIPNQWCPGAENQYTLTATGTYTLTMSTPPWSDATGSYSFKVTDIP